MFMLLFRFSWKRASPLGGLDALAGAWPGRLASAGIGRIGRASGWGSL